MNFTVVIEEKAHADIERNALWWAENHSFDPAVVWKDTIYEQLGTLATMPERHPIAPENALFRIEIREKPLGMGSRPSYRAIFTIKGSDVHVLTIRSAEQDLLQADELTL